ncbi:MAG: beta-propeller fold lactonase family protein [Thermosynechococcaceae cyanobacterium]
MKYLMLRKEVTLSAITLAISALWGTAALAKDPVGLLYTMSNEVTLNKVLVYQRAANGSLTKISAFSTGGKGTGTGLGNQSGLTMDAANHCLYVVNAGSNDISSFTINANGLVLASQVRSGGKRPVSITVNRNLLYVLNAGGAVGDSDNISGFTVERDCKMTALGKSKRALSATNTGPAQVLFNPDGDVLVVTEKATNNILTFRVDSTTGLASNRKVQVSASATPFGMNFGKRNQLFVTEAVGGTANASTVSSYALKPNGELRLITSALGTKNTAACWVVVSNDGRFAYITNTASHTISGLDIAFNGKVSLLNNNGISADTGTGTTPVDLALSNSGLHLYALDNTQSSIAAFRVDLNTGALTSVSGATGLPPGANGLVVR